VNNNLRLPDTNFATFTPTLRNTVGLTYSQNSGSYYVIGQLVYFGVTIITTTAQSLVTTEKLEILGIPFLPGIRGFFGHAFLDGYDVQANIYGVLAYNQNLLFWDYVRVAQLVDNGVYLDVNLQSTAKTRNITVSGVFLRSQINP
jgi:hypothetical protein